MNSLPMTRIQFTQYMNEQSQASGLDFHMSYSSRGETVDPLDAEHGELHPLLWHLDIHAEELASMVAFRRLQESYESPILRLPNEILLKIFGFLAPTLKQDPYSETIDYSRDSKDYQDIKNIRLTCNRFNGLSSPLLLGGSVTVRFDEDSLARFTAISHHPLIGKGIKCVNVELDYYGRLAADDVQVFAAYCVKRLQSVESERQILPAPEPKSFAKRRARSIMPAYMCRWEMAASGRFEGEELAGFPHLSIAHARYGVRYRNCLDLYERGPPIIAEAMARMPRARCLVLSESERTFADSLADAYFYGDSDHHDDAYYEAVLAESDSWARGMQQGSGDPPVEIMATLPIAIHAAGVELTELRINVISVANLRLLPMNNEAQHVQLAAATSALRKFQFRDVSVECSCMFLETRRNDHMKVEEYLTCIHFVFALISSPWLVELDLDFQFLQLNYAIMREWPTPANTGWLMRAYVWPRLQCLKFAGYFCGKDVALLLSDIGSGEGFTFHLNGHMLKGTWAAMLDLMRGSVSQRSTVGQVGWTRGGRLGMLPPSARAVLLSPDAGEAGNQATQYVQGRAERNPVREIEEEYNIPSEMEETRGVVNVGPVDFVPDPDGHTWSQNWSDLSDLSGSEDWSPDEDENSDEEMDLNEDADLDEDMDRNGDLELEEDEVMEDAADSDDTAGSE